MSQDVRYRAGYEAAKREVEEPFKTIALLAIRYVEAVDASWQEAKDQTETDDDLEPSWVAFRDAVRALLDQGAEPTGEQHGS